MTAIDAGTWHTCVIRGGPPGAVECWGRNVRPARERHDHGQLDRGRRRRARKRRAAIIAGGAHTCALTSARRGQVLGPQQSRPARERHDHDRPPRSTSRADERRDRDRAAAGTPHVRAHERRAASSAGATTVAASSGTARPRQHDVPVDVVGLTAAWPRSRRHGHTCALTARAASSAGATTVRPARQRHDHEQPTPVDVTGLAAASPRSPPAVSTPAR